MATFVKEALRAIDSEEQDTVQKGFLTLGEVIAVNCITNFRSDVTAEANAERLDEMELKDIQRAVINWIERNPDHPSVVSAFCVLKQFHDHSLLPFFQQCLARYVQRVLPHMAPLGEILVNLSNVGEEVISDGSFTWDDYAKNLDDAIKYLKTVSTKA